MHVPFVDLRGQYLNLQQEMDAAIHKVIDETAFVSGKYASAFEGEFAAWLGVSHCIACANGTDSIEILLQAYGIGHGDEVIVPAHSWISTSEAVSTVGATPVFADTLKNTFTIDPADVGKKITDRTRAIIPVHLYGLPADMDAIMQLAEKHKLIVIEDCAQSHGAAYNGRKTGTIGHAASFSFYPGKNLGAYGDAGAMVTNDAAIAEKARMIANHGQKAKHNHLIEGRNSRLDGVQGAVLSVKLPHLAEWNRLRAEKAAQYNRLLANSGFELPEVPAGRTHVFHLYVVKCPDGKKRDAILAALKEKNVEAAVHYPTALPLLGAYRHRGFSAADFPVAADACSRIISLPMFPELTDQQQEYVVSALTAAGK